MSESSDRWSVTLAGATLLGRYRVERMIGGGGMANVYLAQDEQLEIPVVVKVPHAAFLAEAGFRDRFDRETRDLVSLQHPHVVRILARGEHEGLPFLIMQFLKGGSLGDRMRRAKEPMAFDDVEPWVRDIAKALDFIHAQGIVHRDIKPDNVLFDEYGHAFLSDFGIAKAVGGVDTGLTVTGATPGSPAYMAPEQPRISALTGQSDQYSYAAALYEALSGRPTFEGETAVDVLIQKQSKLPTHLAETTPAVPRAAANAIMRGLAKDPDERFASCTAMVDAMFVGEAASPAVRPESEVRPAPRVAPAPTTVLPERAPSAAVPAAPPPRTESVGRTATLSGATKALWVVFALVLAVPVASFAMYRGNTPEGSVDTAERGSEPATPAEGPKDGMLAALDPPHKTEDPAQPPAVAKGASAALVGSYMIDRPALESMLRRARKDRPKPPRGVGSWADMERAVKSGMDVTLREDGTFRLRPPGRAGKASAALEGTWKRMDGVVVLKPSTTNATKRGPGVFELRMRAGGGLVFVFGKLSIPLAKQ